MPIAHEDFRNLHVFEHPLVQDKIARARDVKTPHSQFRRLLNEIAGLMTYEVCRELKTRCMGTPTDEILQEKAASALWNLSTVRPPVLRLISFNI